MIDLDMTAINDAMGEGDYATANDIYRNGANSVKGTGLRTLAGFSKNLAGEDEWQMGATYWGEDTYADGIVSDALSGGTYTYMYQRSAGSCCECGRARALADARARGFVLMRARAATDSPGVSCNVAESACTSGYYYNPGFASSYTGFATARSTAQLPGTSRSTTTACCSPRT